MLGSVVCKKDSLGEHDINGLCSSITFIASSVSQNVLPTLESSYTKTASTLEDFTNSMRILKAFSRGSRYFATYCWIFEKVQHMVIMILCPFCNCYLLSLYLSTLPYLLEDMLLHTCAYYQTCILSDNYKKSYL